MMRKSFRLVVLVLMILTLTLGLFACRTSAYWQKQSEDTQGEEADIQKTNGSEKSIVYAALDSTGDLIPAGSATATAAYAVVGYTGTDAELVIPATYDSLPITKVLIASPYSDYKCYQNGSAYTGDDARLSNKTEVTSITFGSNVVFVGAGVCAGMTNLTSVHFEHVQAGVTHTNAFFGISPTITYAEA